MKCLNFVFRLHVFHYSVVRLKYINQLPRLGSKDIILILLVKDRYIIIQYERANIESIHKIIRK